MLRVSPVASRDDSYERTSVGSSHSFEVGVWMWCLHVTTVDPAHLVEWRLRVGPVEERRPGWNFRVSNRSELGNPVILNLVEDDLS